MEPEPKKHVTVAGVSFRVGDLKALLLKTYEAVDSLRIYGQRFEGKWDSVYEDIFPDQFHRFMQAELFQKKLPFIMDYDAGIEVWNTPVWKAQTDITADASDPTIMHVKAMLVTAIPHVKDINYIGSEQIIREYTYDLYGAKQADGSFLVKTGIWTDRSRWDHPDYVAPRPESVARKSFNTVIDINVVNKIAQGL
jgi:hypothetical protein